MALPMVGMEAILLIQKYEANAKKLQKLNQRISDSFKKTSKSGDTIGDAFGEAAIEAMGFNFSLAAVLPQIAAVATGLGVAVAAGRKAIQTFQDLAMETNRLQLIMGATAGEVAGFRLAAEQAGVDITPLSRAMMILEKRTGDYQLRQAAGVKRSNEFERAIKAIGIELTKQDGSLKSTTMLLSEIADWYGTAGASAQATAILTNLFGESARHIIPILQDGGDVFKEAEERAARYGLVLSEDAVKAARDLTKAQADLKASTRGLGAMIGEELTPAYTELLKTLTKLGTTVRQTYALMRAGAAGIIELIKTHGDLDAAARKALEVATDVANVYTDEAKAAEEAAQAEAQLAGARAAANLEAIKIWENAEELVEKLQEKTLKAQERFDQQWEDMLLRRERALEDAERRRLDRLADLWRNYQRRVNDILDAYNKQQEDRAKDNAKKRADLERRLQDALEKLLARHLEKMRQIRRDFVDAASDAARRNDAVAFLQAKRRRDRELRDETERYKLRRAEIIKDFERRLDELEESIREQERLDEERLADQLARARKAYERQLEDLAIALERQERDREISNRRQEEDLERSRDRQFATIQTWFDKERTALETQLAGVEHLLEDSYDKRLEMLRDYFDGVSQVRAAGPGDVLEGMGSFLSAFGSPATRAEGGIDLLTKPTTIVGGEAGPEVHAWAPMKSSTHHSFDPFNVNVGGVSRTSEAQIVPIVMDLLRKVVGNMK